MDKNNKNTSILIVDDEQNFRYLVRETFEEEGFSVIEAENGAQALAIIDQSIPQLILLDIGMPEMDGFEVCENIRNLPQAQKIPIVMLTGVEDLPSIQKAFDAGVTDYISKPTTWPWPILSHRVKSILENYKVIDNSQLNITLREHIEKTVDIGYWQWNCQDNDFNYNLRFAEILNLTVTNKLNYERDFLNSISLSDIFCFKESIRKVINTGEPFSLQIRVKEQAGIYTDSFIWVEATCAILEWDEHLQQAKQICGTIRPVIMPENTESLLDIERKFTQEILLQRNLYSSVFSKIKDAIIVLDDEYKISFMNKAALQLFHIKTKIDTNRYIKHYIPEFVNELSLKKLDKQEMHFKLTGKTINEEKISLFCQVDIFEYNNKSYYSIIIDNS